MAYVRDLLHLQTLTVEGPALSMDKPYYQFTSGVSSVDVVVHLQGTNTLPVTANLTVQQRSLQGETTSLQSDDNLDFWLEQSQLTWQAGEAGLQTVQLRFNGNTTSLGTGGLLVSIESAENADIEAENSTSILTALSSDSLIVGFALQPNQASVLLTKL